MSQLPDYDYPVGMEFEQFSESMDGWASEASQPPLRDERARMFSPAFVPEYVTDSDLIVPFLLTLA